jgi:hypothetical protein
VPRYRFHIRDGDTLLPDLEGVEMAGGLRAVFDQAQEVVRDIVAVHTRRGETIDRQVVKVTDELGTRLFELPFK